MRFRLHSFAIAAAISLLLIPSALAQVSVSPSSGQGSFTFSIPAGSTLEDFFLVSNSSDMDQKITLEFLDAQSTEENSFDILHSQDQAGGWIFLENDEFILEGGMTKELPLTFDIPADTEPGEYLAAIFAANSAIDSARGAGAIQTTSKVGIRAYITVTEGEPQDLSNDPALSSPDDAEDGNNTIFIIIGILLVAVLLAALAHKDKK